MRSYVSIGVKKGEKRMRCAESLAEWTASNNQMMTRLECAVGDLDEETLNRRPDAKTWSPLQVVEHLVLTNAPYLQTISAALDRASSSTGDPEVRLSFFGRILRRAAGPGRNTPALLKMLHPRATPIAKSIVDEWQQQQKQLLALMELAAGVDLSLSRVRDPFVHLLPMNLGSRTRDSERSTPAASSI